MERMSGIIIVTAPPVVHHQRLELQKERFGQIRLQESCGNVSMELSRQYARGGTRGSTKPRPTQRAACGNRCKSLDVGNLSLTTAHTLRRWVTSSLQRRFWTKFRSPTPSLLFTPCPGHANSGPNPATVCEGLLHDGPYHDEIDQS
jgi:hypothetical protein